MAKVTFDVGVGAPAEITFMSTEQVDALAEALASAADNPGAPVTATTEPAPQVYELDGASARWLVSAAHGIAFTLAGLRETQLGAALPVLKGLRQDAADLRLALQRWLPVDAA